MIASALTDMEAVVISVVLGAEKVQVAPEIEAQQLIDATIENLDQLSGEDFSMPLRRFGRRSNI